MARVLEEGLYAIAAHVGGDGQGVDLEVLEEAARIHVAGVADVATLGVGDDELLGIFALQVGDGLLEGLDAEAAHALIEG